MTTYRPDKPTRKFCNEYKVSAVRLTFQPGIMIKDVAQSLDIHPFILSRWRKEYFEGKIVADERKVSKKLVSVPRKNEMTDSERIKKLEHEVTALKKENDFLKKWKRFLAKQRRQNSSL
ncbi:transposase [uncultured Endozoicomonas sp.]|uniref:transposase n=1 Tax=uncultured Endozoicomonas sp. TaxID=432652 RepID=UPI0026116CD1|nr:transposase [uncultured Endozoicomonas sp.]